jgi:hypothetical protein
MKSACVVVALAAGASAFVAPSSFAGNAVTQSVKSEFEIMQLAVSSATADWLKE